LVALIGIAIISFSAILVRLAHVSASTAALFRTLYALPLLLILWLAQRRQDKRSQRERWLAVLAGVFLGLDFASWHRAIDWIGAGMATVLGNMQVIFVALAAWAFFGEKPKARALATLPIVLVGALLISGLGQAGSYGEKPSLGVFAGILTAILYCAYLLILRRSNRSLSPPAGPILDVTLGAVFVSAILGMADGQLDLTFAWPAHGWLLALALGPQVVGWQLITVALPRLAALEASILLLLQPLATVVWGMLIFHERLSPLQAVGATVVVVGVAVMTVGGSVEVEKETPTEAPEP
jgi:drug/metabolite transporter (DMT)-like permease